MSTPGQRTGSHLVVEALEREGVSHLFGVPGESLVGIMNALMDHDRIRMIITRHEEGGSYAAEAFAKASGQVGVCFAARGVGVAHASIALHVAQQDSTPMVMLAGTIPMTYQYREAFQEMDIPAFLRPITKWQAHVDRLDKLPELFEQAFRIARSGRPGPTVLSLPEDLMGDAADHVPAPAGAPTDLGRARPEPGIVAKAVDLLLAAKRPVILAGGGVIRAGAHAGLAALAEALGTPVYAAWRRFDIMDQRHPLYSGSLGLGVRPDLVPGLAKADLVLVLGSRLGEVTTLGYKVPPAGATVIQVDIDASVVGSICRPAVGMVADAGLAMADLLAEVQRRGFPGSATHGARMAAAKAVKDAYTAWNTPRPFHESRPVDPEGAVYTMGQVLPPETIITTDAGNFAGWHLRYYRHTRPGTFVGPTAGSMGYAIPGALGAKLARPDRPVVALVGDGGALMTFSELETATRCKAPFVTLIFNNFLYGAIKGHQNRHFPGRHPGVELGNPDFAALARTFGAFGERVESNAEFGEVLKAALGCGKPAVIELVTHPPRLSAFQS